MLRHHQSFASSGSFLRASNPGAPSGQSGIRTGVCADAAEASPNHSKGIHRRMSRLYAQRDRRGTPGVHCPHDRRIPIRRTLLPSARRHRRSRRTGRSVGALVRRPSPPGGAKSRTSRDRDRRSHSVRRCARLSRTFHHRRRIVPDARPVGGNAREARGCRNVSGPHALPSSRTGRIAHRVRIPGDHSARHRYARDRVRLLPSVHRTDRFRCTSHPNLDGHRRLAARPRR